MGQAHGILRNLGGHLIAETMKLHGTSPWHLPALHASYHSGLLSFVIDAHLIYRHSRMIQTNSSRLTNEANVSVPDRLRNHDFRKRRIGPATNHARQPAQ